MDVISLANRIPTMIFGSKSDDALSDRMNYRYTVALLLLFAVIITTRQFGSETIKCWVPAHFTSNYEQYASQVCWISNTYYIEPNRTLPKEEIQRRKEEIKYYQWVSFLLLLMAFIFYLPRIVWRSFSIRAGLDICDLIDAANSYKSADKFTNRDNYMKYIVQNIDQFVDDDRRYDDKRRVYKHSSVTNCLKKLVPCAGIYLGNYIVILYLVCKLIYSFNVAIHGWFLGQILGHSFYNFGFYSIRKITDGSSWIFESQYFPKVTYCDFFIREWGNPNKSHRYTIQCVLPINLFNQQIFLFIWMWFVLVFTFNVIDLIRWSRRCLPIKSNHWVTQRIKLFNNNEIRPLLKSSPKLTHFLDYYLEPDGIFLIRMIGNNSSDFVATDVIKEMWKLHYDLYDFSSEPQDSNDGAEISIDDRDARDQKEKRKPRMKSKELINLRDKHLNDLRVFFNARNEEIQKPRKSNVDSSEDQVLIEQPLKHETRINSNDPITSTITTELVNENNQNSNMTKKRTTYSTKKMILKKNSSNKSDSKLEDFFIFKCIDDEKI